MTSREEATTLRYAFLTTGVLKALRTLRSPEGSLQPKGREALERGADLLDKMIRGTALTSGDTSLAYSFESVPAARYALLTLRQLEKLTTLEEAQALLQRMRQILTMASKASSHVDQDADFDFVHSFFSVLSKSFSQDAVNATFGRSFGGDGTQLVL